MELLTPNRLDTSGQATIWLTADSTYVSGRPSLDNFRVRTADLGPTKPFPPERPSQQEAFLSLVDAEDQICG